MSGITERIVRRRHPPAAGQPDSDTNGTAVTTNGAPVNGLAHPSAPTLEPDATKPQATEPQPVVDTKPGFIERGRIRRRVRYLRRLRDVQLHDLGGFLVELQRFGRDRPDLVREKLSSALRTDTEIRALERSLGTEDPVREVREAGIGGACESCGAVHGSTDHFCAACGSPLRSPGDAAR
jgi:hypothetical protein